jgi:hypothetical protein
MVTLHGHKEAVCHADNAAASSADRPMPHDRVANLELFRGAPLPGSRDGCQRGRQLEGTVTVTFRVAAAVKARFTTVPTPESVNS